MGIRFEIAQGRRPRKGGPRTAAARAPPGPRALSAYIGGRAAHRELKDVKRVNVVPALLQQTLDKLFPFLARAQIF